MAIQGTDYLVVNRGGVDYKALVSTLPEFDATDLEALIAANAQAISDLAGDVSNNTTNIGTNAASITTNAAAIATNATDIATNAAAIATNAGNITSNTTNISSNATDISNLETALASLELDDLTDVNTAGSADQVLTLLADGSFGFTTIAIPEVIQPKGFIDVSDPAPSSPAHGDTYIQHRDDEADAVADASFVGIAGRTVSEGTFVIFGIDDEWHAGGNANSTQVQADWSETDQTSPGFIKNKPDVYTKTESDAKYLPLDITELPDLSTAP